MGDLLEKKESKAPEYEEIELEFCEDDVVSYLVDENDKEIGFTLLDENGQEVEYYYTDDEESKKGESAVDAVNKSSNDKARTKASKSATDKAGNKQPSGKKDAAHTSAGDDKNPYDPGITREGVTEATKDVNAIYKDGVAVAAEFKGAFDDIKSALDFSGIFKK